MTTRQGPALGAIAGFVAAALGTGVAELVSAVWPESPSPVESVATAVIDRAPLAAVERAIRVFGTRDKVALVTFIVIAVLAAGAALGASRRRGLVPAVVAVFAGASVIVGGRFDAAAVRPVVVGAVSAGVALLTLWRLDGTSAVAPSGGPTDGVSLDRRAFLVTSGALAAVAVATAVVGRRLAAGTRAAAARAGIVLPRPVRPAPPITSALSFAEPQGLSPLVTANRDFYRIDTALAIPDVDLRDWRLRVHGMVDRPFSISYDQLLAMPLVERDVTLVCVSNLVGGPLVGNARWLGVPIDDLLARAGVRPGATQIVARSVDGFTAGFPASLANATSTALVALGMNGEPLPLRHGFPARIVVAGVYGYVSATKWLAELELTSLDDFDAYWVRRGWAKEAPVKTQSRIDVPRPYESVRAGSVTVAGAAWAPVRGIEAVEVRVDDLPWERATLAPGLGDESWRQWRWQWYASPGRHMISVRATDKLGVTQPADEVEAFPDGATGYHSVAVRVSR